MVNKFFLILYSFSALAMEMPSIVKLEDIAIDFSQVSAIYRSLAIENNLKDIEICEGIRELQNGYSKSKNSDEKQEIAKFNIESGQYKALKQLQKLGLPINPNDYNDRFFRLNTDFEHQPKEIVKLIKFLERNNFLDKIGMININKLLNDFSTRPHMLCQEHKNLAYLSKDSDVKINDNSNSVILFTENSKDRFFHEVYTGIYYRPKKENKIDGKYSLLFEDSEEIKNIFSKMIIVNDKVLIKLDKVIEIISSDATVKQKIENLKASAHVNEFFKNSLSSVAGLSWTKLLSDILFQATKGKKIVMERKEHILKINSAPIDIFILYLNYMIEESVKNYRFCLGQADLVSSYSDDDELSSVAIMSEYVQNFMEKFGVDCYEEEEMSLIVKPKKSVEKVSKKINKKIGKKAPAKKFKAKNNKTNKKSVKSSNFINNKNIKLIENESDNSESLSEDINLIESIDPNLLLLDNKDSIVLKKEENIKGVWLSSLNNQDDFSNVKIKLLKSYRMLDTIARLVARKVALDPRYGTASGSVSLALTPFSAKEKMILATKSNRANANLLAALRDVISESKNLSIKLVSDLKNQQENFQKEKIFLKEHSHENINKLLTLRSKIDKIKLHIFLNKKHDKSDHVAVLLSNLLSEFNESNFIILNNAFNMHSEIVMANFLGKNKYSLASVKNLKTNKTYSYQYIGGSLLNCGQCSSILKGSSNIIGFNQDLKKTGMVFFSRGGYQASYPGYFVPRMANVINKKGCAEINKNIRDLCTFCGNYNQVDMTLVQNPELSDSEQDD